jgi:hypothetical protein
MKVFLACQSCSRAREDSGRPIEDWLKQNVKHVLLSQEKKNTTVIQEIQKYHMVKKEFVKKPFVFGVPYCWKCFAILHGMSYSTMKEMKTLAKDGQEKWEHKGKRQSLHPARKQKAVIEFVQSLKDKFGTYVIFYQIHINLGEQHPDSKKVELPSDTKENHYADFSTIPRYQACKCTYSYFCDIWKVHFPELYMPKNSRWVHSCNSSNYVSF